MQGLPDDFTLKPQEEGGDTDRFTHERSNDFLALLHAVCHCQDSQCKIDTNHGTDEIILFAYSSIN